MKVLPLHADCNQFDIVLIIAHIDTQPRFIIWDIAVDTQ